MGERLKKGIREHLGIPYTPPAPDVSPSIIRIPRTDKEKTQQLIDILMEFPGMQFLRESVEELATKYPDAILSIDRLEELGKGNPSLRLNWGLHPNGETQRYFEIYSQVRWDENLNPVFVTTWGAQPGGHAHAPWDSMDRLETAIVERIKDPIIRISSNREDPMGIGNRTTLYSAQELAEAA